MVLYASNLMTKIGHHSETVVKIDAGKGQEENEQASHSKKDQEARVNLRKEDEMGFLFDDRKKKDDGNW